MTHQAQSCCHRNTNVKLKGTFFSWRCCSLRKCLEFDLIKRWSGEVCVARRLDFFFNCFKNRGTYVWFHFIPKCSNPTNIQRSIVQTSDACHFVYLLLVSMKADAIWSGLITMGLFWSFNTSFLQKQTLFQSDHWLGNIFVLIEYTLFWENLIGPKQMRTLGCSAVVWRLYKDAI